MESDGSEEAVEASLTSLCAFSCFCAFTRPKECMICNFLPCSMRAMERDAERERERESRIEERERERILKPKFTVSNRNFGKGEEGERIPKFRSGQTLALH